MFLLPICSLKMKHNGQFIAVQCLLMTDDDNCKLDFCLCLLL